MAQKQVEEQDEGKIKFKLITPIPHDEIPRQKAPIIPMRIAQVNEAKEATSKLNRDQQEMATKFAGIMKEFPGIKGESPITFALLTEIEKKNGENIERIKVAVV